MDRREALKRTALIMGGVISAPTLSVLMNGCNTPSKHGGGAQFTGDEKNMIKEMTDIIIPRTDTPGAVDAKVPDFVVMMVQECYPKDDQDAFHDGLAAYNKWCEKHFEKEFMNLDDEQKEKAVTRLDKEVLTGETDDDSLNFYRTLKELTMLGFFTSETGATETLRYKQTPGDYEGCIPYEKGDKAWEGGLPYV